MTLDKRPAKTSKIRVAAVTTISLTKMLHRPFCVLQCHPPITPSRSRSSEAAGSLLQSLIGLLQGMQLLLIY